MRVLLTLLLACCASLSTPTVRADAVVNYCGQDVDTGPQMSLADAIRIGGLITFACASGTRITITKTHDVKPYTTIDGGNRVILDAGRRQMTMFRALTGLMTVRNVRMSNGRPAPSSLGKVWASVLDVREYLVLEGVEIDNSELAVVVGRNASIVDSRFHDNGLAVLVEGDASVQRSNFAANNRGLQLSLGRVLNSSFTQNRDAGLYVGTSKGLVTIEGNTFAGNAPGGAMLLGQRSATGTQGEIVIRRCSFTRNDNTTGGGAITLFDIAERATGNTAAILRRLPPARFDIQYSQFMQNSGAVAGAIAAKLENSSGMRIRGGLFVGNESAGDGGAIAWSTRSITIEHAMFKGNRAAGRGGALYGSAPESAAVWSVTNSLVVENTSHQTSGAIDAPRLALRNVTIASNAGGVGLLMDPSASNAAIVANTILVNNAAGNCRGIAGAAMRSGNLHFGAADCQGATYADPVLDELYIPNPWGPAVAGDIRVCRDAPVAGHDLLFQARAGERCMSGAFDRAPISRVSRKKSQAEPL